MHVHYGRYLHTHSTCFNFAFGPLLLPANRRSERCSIGLFVLLSTDTAWLGTSMGWSPQQPTGSQPTAEVTHALRTRSKNTSYLPILARVQSTFIFLERARGGAGLLLLPQSASIESAAQQDCSGQDGMRCPAPFLPNLPHRPPPASPHRHAFPAPAQIASPGPGGDGGDSPT